MNVVSKAMPVLNPVAVARLGSLEWLVRAVRRACDLVGACVAARERSHVARTCRELMRLYGIVAAENPALAGRDIYLEVLMRRGACMPAEAAATLDHAEESFAIWPVGRPLCFRDVVHYVAVTEHFRTEGVVAMRSDIGHLVAKLIPQNL